MATATKSKTSDVNGRLWGQYSRDWANFQEPVHRPIYEACFKAAGVGAGTALLDVGCGSGLAAMDAEKLGAMVCGIDASDALLEIARERVPEGTFVQGDLEDLPYSDGKFHVVTGFNSFQYAGNPSAALAEAWRVLRPDGHVIVATWGEPDGMQAAKVVGALKPLLPPPPPGAPGPFALSSKDALADFVGAAGFAPVEIFDVDAPFSYPDKETALRALNSSGVAARAIEHAGQSAVEEAQRNAIAGFVDADGSVCIGATFRCMIATPDPG